MCEIQDVHTTIPLPYGAEDKSTGHHLTPLMVGCIEFQGKAVETLMSFPSKATAQVNHQQLSMAYLMPALEQ